MNRQDNFKEQQINNNDPPVQPSSIHQKNHINQKDKNKQYVSQSSSCKKQEIISLKSRGVTHLSIPSQCQSHKRQQKLKSNINGNQNNLIRQMKRGDEKKQKKKYSHDRVFKKLHKQTQKVKTLEEQYYELQNQLKQVREAIQLQLRLADLSKDDNNFPIIQPHNDDINDNNKVLRNQNNMFKKKVFYEQNHQQVHHMIQQKQQQQLININKEINQICSMINKLFKEREMVEQMNSNYLLMSQINKQNEAEYNFHINQMEDRIRQLRFLLNNKEDLLSYELAICSPIKERKTEKENKKNQHQEGGVRRIVIDYKLPGRQDIRKRGQMQNQYNFVNKIIKEYTKLKKQVQQLKYQVLTHQKQAAYLSKTNPRTKDNQKHTMTMTLQSKNLSSELQNNTDSELCSCPDLLYLPFSIVNYHQSLIYRVGKMYQEQQQKYKELEQEYVGLMRKYQKQKKQYQDNVREYEVKRDMYSFRKKQIHVKRDKMKVLGGQSMNYILKELEEEVEKQDEGIVINNIQGQKEKNQEREEKYEEKILSEQAMSNNQQQRQIFNEITQHLNTNNSIISKKNSLSQHNNSFKQSFKIIFDENQSQNMKNAAKQVQSHDFQKIPIQQPSVIMQTDEINKIEGVKRQLPRLKRKQKKLTKQNNAVIDQHHTN